MPRGDPKVMKTYRLPAVLVARAEEQAHTEEISVTALLERALEHELEAMSSVNEPGGSGA